MLQDRSYLNLANQSSKFRKLWQGRAIFGKCKQIVYALVAEFALLKAFFAYVLALSDWKMLLQKLRNSLKILKGKDDNADSRQISNLA